MRGKTDWDRLRALTDDDVAQAANSDPDALLLTDQELFEFRPVTSVDRIEVKKIRERLQLSQVQFALFFGVSVRTIQEWEQGRRIPNATSRNFLRVVEYAPHVVQAALLKRKRR
ncbi:MAG: helix-turn-helix domain-containing protein [bacterium]|nr:helix-turn-helix domain-containing protein [bacterium]